MEGEESSRGAGVGGGAAGATTEFLQIKHKNTSAHGIFD